MNLLEFRTSQHTSKRFQFDLVRVRRRMTMWLEPRCTTADMKVQVKRHLSSEKKRCPPPPEGCVTQKVWFLFTFPPKKMCCQSWNQPIYSNVIIFFQIFLVQSLSTVLTIEFFESSIVKAFWQIACGDWWNMINFLVLAEHRHNKHKRSATCRFGCFLKWWYPQDTPKWSVLVGKPMVVGYHHFRKPPFIYG